jgi:TP901 family phage tail tape measure protein
MSQTVTQWILELVDHITPTMNNVISSSQRAASSVDDVGNGLRSVSAIDLFAINDAVQNIANEFDKLNAPGAAFNAQLKDLEALTGVSGDALDELGEKGRATAKVFGGDASAMLESYKGVLSRFGPDIAKNQDALNLMGMNIGYLSKGMKNDAVGAMDALTTSMLQFGVDLSDPMKAAQEMTTMMNVMAAGAKEGAAEVPGISESLKVAGVQALSSKVSFIETNAAIQAMAQGGKYGAEAGTALRNVMGKMAGIDVVPKEAAEKLEALGVNYDIVSDKTLPFTTRLRELKKAQGDATIMAQIFGVENAAAAEILLRSVDYQDQLQIKITGTNTAVEQANIVMSGYNETMSRVKAWFTDIAIGMFDVTSKITPFIDGLAGSVMIFANLANARTGVVLLFETLSTMPVIGRIVTWGSSLVTGGFGMMVTGAKALGIAIMNIPIIGWIAAIIAGLIALGTYFYNTSATFRGFLWGLWDAVKTVFTGVWGFIKEVDSGILDLLKGVFNPLSWFDPNYSFSDGFSKIADAATNYGKSIGEAFGKGKQEGMEDFYKENPDKRPKSDAPSFVPYASNGNPEFAFQPADWQMSDNKFSLLRPSPVIKPGDLKTTNKKTSDAELKGSGSSSGIKNISQKIDIKNYFNISGDADKNNFEAIAEKIVRAINDKLSDGIVAIS